MIRFVFIDGGVNLKVWGLTGTWGAVGIEMPKFEGKKGDFAKICKNWGGLQPPPPGSAVHGTLCMVSEGISLSQQTILIFHLNVQKQDQCDLDLDLGLHRERSKSCTTSPAFYLVNLFV